MPKFSEATPFAGPLGDTDLLGMSEDLGGGSFGDRSLNGVALRTGGAANTAPLDWSGFHRFGGNGAGNALEVGEWTPTAGFGALSARLNCVSAASLPFGSTRVTMGDLSTGNTETWSGGMINVLSGVTAAPTDAVSPFSALEAAVLSDPASDGGSPVLIPEIRGVDLDMTVATGSVTDVNGATARLRNKAGASVTTFTGYHCTGPNSLDPADVAGTLSQYTGMHVGFDPRGASPDPAIGAYTGVQIDAPDTDHPVTGAAVALDIIGDGLPLQLGSTIKQQIDCQGATGQLNIRTAFNQNGGAFNAGNALNFVGEVTTEDAAFYSSAMLNFTCNWNNSNSPNSELIGASFSNAIAGGINVSQKRTGARLTVSGDSGASQHIKGLDVGVFDAASAVKYKYGMFVGAMPATGGTADTASLGLAGTDQKNGIHFGAKDSTQTGANPAKIWWDGTDLLCTVGGVNYILNEGTTKP